MVWRSNRKAAEPKSGGFKKVVPKEFLKAGPHCSNFNTVFPVFFLENESVLSGLGVDLSTGSKN